VVGLRRTHDCHHRQRDRQRYRRWLNL
jgi:hypothetical protein